MNRRLWHVIGALLVASGICAAQPATATPPAGPGLLKVGSVTVTGNLRARVEGFDWFTANSGDNAYAYSGNIFRTTFSQKREKWDWGVELALPFLLGLPSNAVAPGVQGALGLGANYYVANNRNQNAAMLFPKQAFVRITQFGASKASSLKLGRFEFLDGSETTPKNANLAAVKTNRVVQRLIGAFVFTDVQRSFDGMLFSYAKPAGTFTFMGAIPTRGVFQVDGWGWNKAAIGYSSYAKSWGRNKHAAETRFFAIYYDDWRRGVVKVDNRPAAARATDFANIRIWSAGGNSLHLFDTKAGAIDLLAWGVSQWGDWGVQKHSAYALDFEAGYQPKILPKLKPWLRGGASVTSGDGNPNDNSHETFFQIAPTPRPYAKFPFFNMMNSVDRFGILTLRPHPKVTIVSEFHSLALQNANDFWYTGGGIFQPWTFGYTGRATSGRKSLANLYDTSVEYRYNPWVTFTAYFGHAQGLAGMKQIYPLGKDGNFGYGEVVFRF